MVALSGTALTTLVVASALGAVSGPLLALIAARVRRPPARPSPVTVISACALATALFALTAWRFDEPYELAAYGLFWAGAVVLAIVDALDHRLPDVVLLPTLGSVAALLLIGGLAEQHWAGVIGVLAGGLGLFVIYLVLALISPRGIGMGDVKLALLLGAVCGHLGLTPWLVGLVGGFAIGAVVSLIGLALRRLTLRSMVPFGPSMIAGATVAFLMF